MKTFISYFFSNVRVSLVYSSSEKSYLFNSINKSLKCTIARYSGLPPTFVAITGVPQAKDSGITKGGSLRE